MVEDDFSLSRKVFFPILVLFPTPGPEPAAALHLAATNKMTNTLEILLENGSSVHEKNDSFWTPLDCAAAAGAYKCVLKLLEHGSKAG